MFPRKLINFNPYYQESPDVKKERFVTVLKQQRANNIQIEIKRLPAARHIRTAILNMDQSFFNKEMIEVFYIIS